MTKIALFQEEVPSLDSYWRSIILFGRNVATYKFALAKSLLDIAPTGKTDLSLEELAHPFSKHLCEHLLHAPKQATSPRSEFLSMCQKFNDQDISHEQLIQTTIRKGFTNVIDAFHHVNTGDIPIRFYEKHYSRTSKKIILTDDIFRLQEMVHAENFLHEVEARWNLVENAWGLGVPSHLLNVQYDDQQQLFFLHTDKHRRKNVTSARNALNGYQKGKCFYCYDHITVDPQHPSLCDVDHFFPHLLQPSMPHVNINGVWNLVLTCRACNRGPQGKSARIPAMTYLERLYKRNDYLISSHHPLRETLITQTGDDPEKRKRFLPDADRTAIQHLIHRWETEPVGEATF